MKLSESLWEYVGNAKIEEFTMECNPDDVTQQLAETMKKAGINRVSMGAQTFSADRLKMLNRRHNPHQVVEAVDVLRNSGIGNISIDLMFGFPGETLNDWKDDLITALSLNVEHISAYSLMYEEGTQMYHQLEKGLISEIDEELSLDMYDMLIDKMAESGYEHYEISNFARKGFRSKHNSSYWQGIPYLGLGAAAHSYNIDSRQWNISNVKEYISLIQQAGIDGYDAIKGKLLECEILSETEKYNDIITTALRTKEGVNLDSLAPSQRQYLLDSTKDAFANGLLAMHDNHVCLTRKGLFVSDSVMEQAILI